MWLKTLLHCCLYLCGFKCVTSSNLFTPVVEIGQGQLRGLRSVSGQNRYYGIQYADSERFQPPREPKKWEGVFNAINQFGFCPQNFLVLAIGSEDCLTLDVYTPEWAKSTDRLPVMVFIHGGGYYYGSKAHYDPEFLVVKNVIVVIINYRLTVLGFLCLNGVSNLGLKDQVAALKWIRKNIAAFGGDPDNVTLCGQSAGASLAMMHLLSESSKGLFHKVIALSGTVLSPWAFNLEPYPPALGDARKLAPANSEQDIYNVFLNAQLNALINAANGTSVNPKQFKYAPCIDLNATDPFFHDTPYNSFKSGNYNKVPIMMGHTEVEGVLLYSLTDRESVADLDGAFDERLPSVFSWCSDSIKREIGTVLRTYYFGDERITRGSVKGLVQLYSDWLVHATIHDFSNLLTETSDEPLYAYIFSYKGDRNFAKFLSGVDVEGTTHIDDLFYIFKPAGVTLLLTGPDRLFIDRMTSMVANFMRYGDPTPNKSNLLPIRWLPNTRNSSRALRLADTLSMTATALEPASEVYRDVLCTYGHSGYVPCDSKGLCDPR